MNKNIFNAFIVGSLALGLASCSENSWNDRYLDGFEEGVDYEGSDKVVTGTYTLTDADYATVASLLGSAATTDEEKAVAKAIGSNLYFNKTSVYPAPVALPYFFNTASFPYFYAPNGSTIDVSYREASTVPAELSAIAAADTYTVSAADYQLAWGSDEDFINGFAPMTPASTKLPSILADVLDDAVEGTYAVVTYNEASVNPIFQQVGGDAPAFELTSVIGSVALDDVVDIKGIVTAIDTRGFVLTDNSGSILCYQKSGFNLTDVEIGSEVSLTATISAYNKGFQIAINSVDDYKVEGVAEVVYPAPKHYTGAMMDEVVKRTDNALAEYVSITGKASVSGNYYNFLVEGAEASQGSGYMVPDNIRALITDGEEYYITGYFTSISSGKYMNIVITGVTPAKNAAKVASRGAVVDVPTVTKNAVYYRGSRSWAVAEGVLVLNPSDYTAMGVSNNKLTSPEIYIPIYLKNQLPYAQSGDQKYVVYNGTKVDLFVFDGSEWSINNNGLETVTGRFTKKNGAWAFVKYIGKAEFDKFVEESLMLNRSYLLVSGDICAIPVDKSSNYGYLKTADVSVANDHIVMNNDESAFTFASFCEIEGTRYNCPEGQFLFRDSNGRYLYMQGTYTSANVSAAPTVEGSEIANNYLWTAALNADGTWTIKNVSNDKILAYSSNYGSFGVYASLTENDHMPALFLMNE